jgi:hypothetical protein
MVQVVVGTGASAKTFNVYKDLLTFYSDYFRTALKNCWMEGQTNTIRLPDEDPEVFESFNYWIFAKRLYHKNASNNDKPNSVEEIPLSYKKILDIYFFADRRGSPELANSTLDVLFTKMCQLWDCPWPEFKVIYENTIKGCALRRYIVDDILAACHFNAFEKFSHFWPKELLVDIICTAYENKINIVGPEGKQSRDTYTMEAKRTFCEKYHDHSAITKEDKKEFA